MPEYRYTFVADHSGSAMQVNSETFDDAKTCAQNILADSVTMTAAIRVDKLHAVQQRDTAYLCEDA